MQRRDLLTLPGSAALAQTTLAPEVVSTATRTILDTIGCAIGGSTAGPSQIASETTSTHPASVLCTTIKTSPYLAAFADGVMIRYLDFNDGYVSATHSPGHPSDTLAALLTAAEISGSSGRDLIVASVLANEVFCKILDGLEAVTLGVDHTTITGLAAAVGSARLMRLSEQQITDVIGITIAGNTAIHQGRVGTQSNSKAPSLWSQAAMAVSDSASVTHWPKKAPISPSSTPPAAIRPKPSPKTSPPSMGSKPQPSHATSPNPPPPKPPSPPSRPAASAIPQWQ